MYIIIDTKIKKKYTMYNKVYIILNRVLVAGYRPPLQ